LRDNRFLKLDNSLIAEIVSLFSVPPVASDEVNAPPVIVHYPSSEVDGEEKDYECWDGDDRDFSPATCLDWRWMDSMREPCEGDVTLEDTPHMVKGRRELLN
jgi:hypothetical protein